jgi:hypothetical protein
LAGSPIEFQLTLCLFAVLALIVVALLWPIAEIPDAENDGKIRILAAA